MFLSISTSFSISWTSLSINDDGVPLSSTLLLIGTLSSVAPVDSVESGGVVVGGGVVGGGVVRGAVVRGEVVGLLLGSVSSFTETVGSENLMTSVLSDHAWFFAHACIYKHAYNVHVLHVSIYNVHVLGYMWAYTMYMCYM